MATINGFSAHADRSELLDWAGKLQTPPKHTFIVHGEEEAAFALSAAFKKQLGFGAVHVPELGQSFAL
ncbi:MAG: hypothetical protein M5U34_18135 [Chloroflexi bacterium]|nr:hypothetical protein [Chloroflexota bacterium]